MIIYDVRLRFGALYKPLEPIDGHHSIVSSCIQPLLDSTPQRPTIIPSAATFWNLSSSIPSELIFQKGAATAMN